MGELGGRSAPNEPSDHRERQQTTLKDRRLEERAIRNGWAVPDNVKTKILQRLAGIVDPETPEGATAEIRYVIQAAKTIAQADLRQQQIDLARQQAEADRTAGTLAELVGAAEQRAEVIRGERREGAIDGTAGDQP